jgi:secondary thiamine-phosphate synthase enzyme
VGRSQYNAVMMTTVDVTTSHRAELVPVTHVVQDAVTELGLREGAVLVYSPHTTCAPTINEGADPDVRGDIARFLGRLVPRDEPDFRHLEGNSDAHVLVSLVGPSLMVPVREGQLLLGRWQTLFLAEFDGPRDRRLWITALGSGEG